MKIKTKIFHKYFFVIYSCLILNADGGLFSAPRSSLNIGGSPSGFSSRGSRPDFSIGNLRSLFGSNYSPKQSDYVANKYPQQPAYNPFYNVGQNVAPTLPARNVAIQTSIHKPAFNTPKQGTHFNFTKSTTFLNSPKQDNFWMKNYTQQPAYNSFYNGGKTVVPHFPQSFLNNNPVNELKDSLKQNNSGIHKYPQLSINNTMLTNATISHTPSSKQNNSSFWQNLFKGWKWTSQPHHSPNTNVNDRAATNIEKKLDRNANILQPHSNKPFIPSLLSRLGGYTIPTMQKHNARKFHQTHQEKNYTNIGIIIIVAIVLFVILIVGVIFMLFKK